MLPEMQSMGFDAEPKDEGQIRITAIPYGTSENAVRDALDELIQTEGISAQATTEEKRERLAAALARKQAVNGSHALNSEEAQGADGLIGRNMTGPSRTDSAAPFGGKCGRNN